MATPILHLAAKLCAAVSFSVMAQPVLLENITLVDVKNLQLKSGQTITFDGDKITAIYVTGSQKRPADSSVLDMQDHYVLPGLIDAHVHHATEPDDGDNAAVTQQRLRALLRGGVTTVRDMGGDVRVLTGLKHQAERDLVQSPDIYYSVIIGGSEFFSDSDFPL